MTSATNQLVDVTNRLLADKERQRQLLTEVAMELAEGLIARDGSTRVQMVYEGVIASLPRHLQESIQFTHVEMALSRLHFQGKICMDRRYVGNTTIRAADFTPEEREIIDELVKLGVKFEYRGMADFGAGRQHWVRPINRPVRGLGATRLEAFTTLLERVREWELSRVSHST